MAKPVARIVALQVALGAGLLLVIARAGWLQLVHGSEFSRQARKQRTEPHELPARRGTIYDRNGRPLAVSEAVYRVQISIPEVKDTTLLIRRASRALGVTTESLRRSFRPGAPLYPYFHGPFKAGEIEPLRGMPGVRFITNYSRGHPSGLLAGPVIGAVASEEGHGQSGIERILDSVLSGRPGKTVDLRDVSGRLFESPDRLIEQPVPGHDVVLTIDAELQEIAENALRKALTDLKADGGDVVFMDPRTGELLALASLSSTGAATSATVFTSPFEPGSTAKPFTAAALLALDRVSPNETVSGENGKWTFVTRGRSTRTITDTHEQQVPMTLARVIQVSSNIGIAKFASKLRWEEQFDMLRAFGFGVPTGVEYPSEAGGSLEKPNRWRTGDQQQSMAMGYSISVTPVQLAAAYGVFANDGLLLAPTLIREIRSSGGERLFRSTAEVVRRVVTPDVARRIREFLAEASSDSGTGSQAQVRGGILGKTGTAKQAENGSYRAGKYRASFAAIYPAKDPQLVAIVTIDNPHGVYYGGVTAAPLTASMLRQAISARNSVIDRNVIADAAPRRSSGEPAAPPPVEDLNTSAASIRLPVGTPPATPGAMELVPEVIGRPVRKAVFAVHQRGFRVQLVGSGGVVTRSVPSAGDSLALGKTVVVYLSTAKSP